MDTSWQIVVASSNLEGRRRITTVLRQLGLDPICLSSVSQCRELLGKEQVNLIFCDRVLPDGDYDDIVAASHATEGRPPVVLACRHNNSEYLKAIGSGVFGVITEACHPSDVEWMMIKAKRDYFKRAQTRPGSGPQKTVPIGQTTGGVTLK